MVQLGRRTRGLLNTVNGKPHALSDDHDGHRAQAIRSPASSGSSLTPVSDDDRSPEATSDEDSDNEPPSQYKPPPGTKFIRPPAKRPEKGNTVNIHGSEDGKRRPRNRLEDKAKGNDLAFKLPNSNAGKRTDRDEETLTPSELLVLSSQDTKRPRQQYGSQSKYGKKPRAAQKGGLRKPKHNASPSSTPGSSPLKQPQNDFRLEANSSSQIAPSSQASEQFRRPAGMQDGDDEMDMSSPLSILEEDLDDEVEEIHLDLPTQLSNASTCPLCGDLVDTSFKAEFEVEHCRGRSMNLRMQERFCKAHKARSAKLDWRDRAYPEVDWDTLQARLKKHNAHIQAVLDGSIRSQYKTDLEKKLRNNKTRTAMQAHKTENTNAAQVGYYGTRGEKMMTDYVMQAFSDKLRQSAGSDKLMASMGVAGGVSGYVHSVLVPELAVSLVMEDNDVDAERAREIIKESADIGELLNAEEEEKLPRAARSPPPTYGSEDADGAMERIGVTKRAAT